MLFVSWFAISPSGGKWRLSIMYQYYTVSYDLSRKSKKTAQYVRHLLHSKIVSIIIYDNFHFFFHYIVHIRPTINTIIYQIYISELLHIKLDKNRHSWRLRICASLSIWLISALFSFFRYTICPVFLVHDIYCCVGFFCINGFPFWLSGIVFFI